MKKRWRILGGALAAAGALCAGSLLAPGLGQALFGAESWEDWQGTAVFLGDSLTEFCDLAVYYPGLNAVNSGVSGDFTGGMRDRLEEDVFAYAPDIVVLHGGINDLFMGADEEHVTENLFEIVRRIRERLPRAAVIVQSLYPVDEAGAMLPVIRRINERLAAGADARGYRYADVYPALQTETGGLDRRYTLDGLHLNDAGYRAVAPVLTAQIQAVTGRGILG